MNRAKSRPASPQSPARRIPRGLTAALSAATVVAITLVAAACGGGETAGAGDSATASPSPVGVTVLAVTGGGRTVELAMADVEALPALTGWAGMKTQTGKVLGPDEYTGVRLADVAAVVDGLVADATVVVKASDGYSVEFTSDQLTGEGFTTYDPETGDEVAATQGLTPMLTYARNGAPLDAADTGPLTVQIAQPAAGEVVDARWAVSDVVAIEILAP